MAAILALAVAGCGSDAAKSKLFSDASQLVVGSPKACQRLALDDNGGGDGFIYGKSDTELGLDQERVYAAIFAKYPQVQGGQIVNPEDAVWVWHSGMRADASPVSGKLFFSDGISPDKTGAPKDLKSCGITNTCSALVSEFSRTGDKVYFYLMWAWNSDREISYFSDDAVKFCFTIAGDTAKNDPCKNCQ